MAAIFKVLAKGKHETTHPLFPAAGYVVRAIAPENAPAGITVSPGSRRQRAREDRLRKRHAALVSDLRLLPHVTRRGTGRGHDPAVCECRADGRCGFNGLAAPASAGPGTARRHQGRQFLLKVPENALRLEESTAIKIIISINNEVRSYLHVSYRYTTATSQ